MRHHLRMRRIMVVIVIVLMLGAPASGAISEPITYGGGEETEEVRYEVSPSTGAPRSRYIATLTNLTSSTIEYGNPYSIARRTKDGWKRLSHGMCAFTMEARLLPPGTSATQRIGWLKEDCGYRTLRSGLYRVSKTIRIQGDELRSDRGQTVRAKFRVRKP